MYLHDDDADNDDDNDDDEALVHISVICCNSNSVLLEYVFCTLVVPVGNRLNSSGEPAEFQWRTG